MHVKITATAATVFLYDVEDKIDKVKLRTDYHNLYHSKRPADPVIFDKFIFVNQSDSKENLDQLQLVDDLVKIHDLRSVNFIIISKEEKSISEEALTKFKDLMSKWDTHFKRNSYSGFLTMRISTQNFKAILIDNYQIRCIEHLPLGLKGFVYGL